MTNLKLALAIGLAAAALALILTNLLAGQVFLQSPYAEPAHNLFMSLTSPMHKNSGNNAPVDQESHSHLRMQGVIANNVLGGQAGAAGRLAAIVLYGFIVLAAAAFIVSWKQNSLLIAWLLAASDIILITFPLIALANINFAVTTFQGLIVGVVVGLAIFGLGLAKYIRKVKALTVAAARFSKLP